MPLVYRSMYAEGTRPRVGNESSQLGVRVPPHPTADVFPDLDGNITPGKGMSVAPHWRSLPRHLIPRRLRDKVPTARGREDLVCWRMGEGTFTEGPIAPDLTLTIQSQSHGTVGPPIATSLVEFQAALSNTQDLWVVDEN